PLERTTSLTSVRNHPPRSTRGTRIVRPSRGEFGVKATSCPSPRLFSPFFFLSTRFRDHLAGKRGPQKRFLGAFRRPCEIDFTEKIT
ncbi:unnamed protein product, partial [Heterotrigona itama]